MKKKIITLVTVCVIALGAYWNMNHNKEKSFLNCLTLENVEAIAACEVGYGGSCWIDEEYFWCCTLGVMGCAPCD